MILRKTNFVFIILLVLLGCGTSKKTVDTKPLPQWVKNKPVHPEYYIGVGSSLKTVNVNEYKTTAKNNALADLASEVSVNISSSSVLQQFENTFGYGEDFQSDIRTESAEQLEGYNLVNTFEDDTHYWVYYRMSKKEYQKIKEQRKNEAIQIGLDFYQKAQEYRQNNQHLNAFTHYIKGLESVKGYFSESLETTYNQQTIYLGNELFSGLMSLVNDIEIVPGTQSLTLTKSKPLPSGALTFTVVDNENEPVGGVPVVFLLNNRPLRNNKTQTPVHGKVTYASHKIKAPLGANVFSAQIDLEQIIRAKTSDVFIRKLLKKVREPKGEISIMVLNPTFFVQVNEQNLDKELTPKIIEPKLEQLLSANKIPVSADKSQADYIMQVEINTQPDGVNGKFHYAKVEGAIKVYSHQEQLVLLQPIENIQGVQLNFEQAGIDGYQKLANYLERNLIHKLNEVVK